MWGCVRKFVTFRFCRWRVVTSSDPKLRLGLWMELRVSPALLSSIHLFCSAVNIIQSSRISLPASSESWMLKWKIWATIIRKSYVNITSTEVISTLTGHKDAFEHIPPFLTPNVLVLEWLTPYHRKIVMLRQASLSRQIDCLVTGCEKTVLMTSFCAWSYSVG